MRRRRSLVAALVLFAAVPFGPAWGQGFLAAVDDLPLAPGLAEMAGHGVAFDTPTGRIVEALARGPVKSAEVLAFYSATLPQLGWTRESDVLFRRDAEVLRLELTAEKHGLTVRFAVSPE
ncbi:MAG: hypothetical protein HY985_06665 [Magnetospirillum sp.]|nr:hypothetical protein [Magnetospirillum sp.]